MDKTIVIRASLDIVTSCPLVKVGTLADPSKQHTLKSFWHTNLYPFLKKFVKSAKSLNDQKSVNLSVY